MIALTLTASAAAVLAGAARADDRPAGFFERESLLGVTRPDMPPLAAALFDPEAQPDQGPDPQTPTPDIGPEEPPKPSLLRTLFTNWKGEVSFGLELASGNNDRARFRGGFNINKQYDGHKTALRTDYTIARNNQGESENRLTSQILQDWDTGGSKFSGVFLRADGDIDRFQDYDLRVNLATGAKYTLVQSDKTNLFARVGGSVRREFGGPNDDYVPEGAFFLSFDRTLSDTQRVNANFDYLPEIERPSRYRLRLRAAWEIDIDPEAGLGLRMQLDNRYDARPSRRPERNDLDFSVRLFWKF
ncbi:MAG: DUF481 domain-containing protein [Phycisphaerales bacterium]